MFTVGSATSLPHNATKSTIQRYLKTREHHQLHSRSRRYFQRNTSHFSGGFAIESKVSNLPLNNSCIRDFNLEQAATNDINNQDDFNYSQKLFHISDGNLYSIFSPIQGKSYGMKPSFLRKQKYTVQECHSRGRKSMRKGLKFHNFLPSESVTSEKGNGSLKSKWKVHSECRLREEHGTKQITISNWSQSVQESPDEPLSHNLVPSNSNAYTTVNKQNDDLNFDNKINSQDEQTASTNNPYDFKLNVEDSGIESFENLREINTVEHKKKEYGKVPQLKKGSLKSVLNSLLDKPALSENICDFPDAHTKLLQSQKHRRKPTQTRRVVPYNKYLSILEEDDSSPLDLSSKCSEDKCLSPKSILEETLSSSEQNKLSCDDKAFLTEPKCTTSFLKPVSALSTDPRMNSKIKNSDSIVNQSSLAHLLQKQVVPPLVLLSSPLNHTLNVGPAFSQVNHTVLKIREMEKVLKEKEPDGQKHQSNMPTNKIKLKTNYPPLHSNPGPSFSGNMQYAVHKSFVKNSQSKSRRRSQRSVIKKNLEDTFKQNGFLVKTKQVSDGEATFCKFRQLRKYTRYYLKSWQQHLPDEVHKMWKGFLPPKTVLPPVSGLSESTNGFH